MYKVLIPRLLYDAQQTAQRLKDSSFLPCILPFATLTFLPCPFPARLPLYRALIATSANALRILTQQIRDRPVLRTTLEQYPLFVIGFHTSDTARQCGFQRIINAQGNSENLQTVLLDHFPPPMPLLYLTGKPRKISFEASLREKGYSVSCWELYEIQARTSLTSAEKALLKDPALTAVLHYSPASAQRFCQLILQENLSARFEKWNHHCISAATAEMLTSFSLISAPLRLYIAAQPNESSLLETLTKKEASI